MSSEQPPHCHLRCFFRFVLSQLHSVKSALEHARVTAQANAAELMACTNAVSRLPTRGKGVSVVANKESIK